MTDTRIFDFERDFAASLRCVPMAVRLKLDLCGVKLSLRQWSRFTGADRCRLLVMACDTPTEIEDFRILLIGLVADRAGELAKPLMEDIDAASWNDVWRVPQAVAAFARQSGLPAPTPAQWARLTRLQRFALVKLSRDHHDNLNFAPAMHEFGLADRRAA
jgi:hypothetical protein